MTISFFVPGIPKPAGSKRAFMIKKGGSYTGRVAMVDDSGKKGSDWRSDVRAVACETYDGPPLAQPLVVDFEFRFPRPKSHFHMRKSGTVMRDNAPAWHTSKPDRTKCTRGIEDALTGLLWKDDSIIVAGRTIKRYCNGDERPGVTITVRDVAASIGGSE